MSSQSAAWFDEAFFATPDLAPVDGTSTNRGPLWHSAAARWGHSMHTMCSYHGMFPAKLVHYFLQRHSDPGDLVLDPFSGRGTTTLQARVEGRRSAGNDLNPLAYVLTRAKAQPPDWSRMIAFVGGLERDYSRTARRSDPDVPADIEMLFHDRTLRQLVYLRKRLQSRPMDTWGSEEFMLAGAVAGILHGGHRSDGSSGYLSISMPNTFSMSPEYVRKYIRENDLVRLDQNVFECLRDKLARLYLDSCEGERASASMEDAFALLKGRTVRRESVNLVLTSPPYLRVVNYGTSNWIRLWWLGFDGVARQRGAGRKALDASLDHQHAYETYREFMARMFKGTRRVLRRNGVAVYVIGDVTNPSGSSIALAERVWEEAGRGSGLTLLDLIEDEIPSKNKVSRIWGDTKGQATDRDCVLVLAREDGDPKVASSGEMDWDEPYRDAGPDAAHARLRQRRSRA
jgi:hypothetical protein